MFYKNKHNKTKNKRKPIEIYFILYLIAIVMLISTGKEVVNNDKNKQFNYVEFPFRIKSEKPILTCKIITDTNGQKQYQLDSINYILDYGNVTDVKYEFVVEDTELKHKVQLSNNNNNQIFSFVYDNKNRTVIFHWKPNIENAINKTFNVYVTATATFIDNYGNNKQKLQSKTQFALIITNDYMSDNYYEQIVSNDNSNTFSSPVNIQYYQPQITSSEFDIKPQILIIRGIAGDTWENEVMCYGFNPKIDLLKPPTIELTNNPNDNGATVSNIIKDNSILLKGKVPEAGRSKILISVQRKGDLKEQKIYFDIYPISIQSPNVPNIMFPNIEYSINPNIPNNMTDIASYIKEKENDKVRFRAFNNETIKFIPNNSDIGKTLTFERYYNGKLIGQKHQINVIDFPNPQITRLSNKNNDTLILETISYGLYNNRDNTIKEVRLSGNAKSIQQYGKTHVNRNKFEFLEQFLIVPKDNSKPFNFTVFIIDQRGKFSDTKSK